MGLKNGSATNDRYLIPMHWLAAFPKATNDGRGTNRFESLGCLTIFLGQMIGNLERYSRRNERLE